MPPAQTNQPAFTKDERVLCFHGELLYEAKILDSKLTDPADKKSAWLYRVHYKGWKNTWDDWVNGDRVRKLNDENKELAQNLKRDFDEARRPPPKHTPGKRGKGASDHGSRASEERHSSIPAAGRGQKRGRDYDLEKEEAFINKPSVRIHCPDDVKSILVDDWENVTKNQNLVKLPVEYPVNKVLNDYCADEKPKRRSGTAEIDILEETVAGLKEYFATCLGRMLLYRFERLQYLDIRKLWENADADSEWDGKGPGDVYGAEHLARLLVSLPELVAQTNMDHQSVSRLREEMTKLNTWMGKNSAAVFKSEYTAPSEEYIEKVKNV